MAKEWQLALGQLRTAFDRALKNLEKKVKLEEKRNAAAARKAARRRGPG
jgi:hypothetical protein